MVVVASFLAFAYKLVIAEDVNTVAIAMKNNNYDNDNNDTANNNKDNNSADDNKSNDNDNDKSKT